MKISEYFWIIQRPQGDYFLHTLSPLRKECIQRFENYDVGSWKGWYGRGFRCAKVKLVVA